MRIVIHGRPSGRPVCEQTTLNVQLSVIDVADLEGAVSMTRRDGLQLEIEGSIGIGRAAAFAL